MKKPSSAAKESTGRTRNIIKIENTLNFLNNQLKDDYPVKTFQDTLEVYYSLLGKTIQDGEATASELEKIIND